MKEIIEKKLGMSIEDYFDNFIKSLEGEVNETEEHSPLFDMSSDELDFLLKYVEEHGINKKGWKKAS